MERRREKENGEKQRNTKGKGTIKTLQPFTKRLPFFCPVPLERVGAAEGRGLLPPHPARAGPCCQGSGLQGPLREPGLKKGPGSEAKLDPPPPAPAPGPPEGGWTGGLGRSGPPHLGLQIYLPTLAEARCPAALVSLC